MAHIDTSTNIPAVQILEGSAPSTPSSGFQKVFIDSSDHHLKRKNSSGVVKDIEVPGYILIQDQKSQNSNGQTLNSGAWRTRDLNTIVTDTTGAVTLNNSGAGPRFNLPAGTYRAYIRCPMWAADRYQARLQNITDSATTLWGSSENNTNLTPAATNSSDIIGRFTISAAKDFEVQVQSTANATGGLAGQQSTEIFTIVELTKE